MTEANLPEGWYRDPSLPGTKRWWDGVAWTNHVRPDEDAGLGWGASTRSAASSASAPAAPVTEPTTFAVPSEFAQTKPVSSVGSASVGSEPVGLHGAAAAGAAGAPLTTGDRWVATEPEWGDSSSGQAAMPSRVSSFAVPTSVAELESVDYTPMERSWAPSAASGPIRRAPMATGTAGAWLLALSPILNVLLVIGVGSLVLADPLSTVGAISSWVASVIMLAWLVLATITDFRRLGALGYTSRPSVFWIILGPLPYLISRAVHVHRATDRGTATLWVYLGLSILIGVGVGLFVVSALPDLLLLLDSSGVTAP